MNIAETLRERSYEAEMRGQVTFDRHEFRDLHGCLKDCAEMQETLESDLEELQDEIGNVIKAVRLAHQAVDAIDKVVDVNDLPDHFKVALAEAVQECRKRLNKINAGTLREIGDKIDTAICQNDISH